MLKSDPPLMPLCNEMIGEIGSCETNYDLFRILRLICTETQCKTFMVSEIPKDDKLKLHDILIVSNWDPEVIREFDRKYEGTFVDLFQTLRDSVNPVRLELPLNIGDEKLSPEGKYPDYEFGDCIFFPVYDRAGRKGMIGFSLLKSHDHHRFAKLGFLSDFIFDKFMEIKKETSTQNNTLSDREIECLNWTALGKTSYEIGVILDISLNTVNHYLNNASKKLNCVNRTHAVAKCIQEGIIEF